METIEVVFNKSITCVKGYAKPLNTDMLIPSADATFNCWWESSRQRLFKLGLNTY